MYVCSVWLRDVLHTSATFYCTSTYDLLFQTCQVVHDRLSDAMSFSNRMWVDVRLLLTCANWNTIVKKSHCLSLGKLANVDIGPVLLNNHLIAWSHTINYLCVHLLSGQGMPLKLHLLKGPFTVACNNIFSHSRGVDEIIQLSLQESYCLPVLLYALPALYLKLN